MAGTLIVYFFLVDNVNWQKEKIILSTILQQVNSLCSSEVYSSFSSRVVCQTLLQEKLDPVKLGLQDAICRLRLKLNLIDSDLMALKFI